MIRFNKRVSKHREGRLLDSTESEEHGLILPPGQRKLIIITEPFLKPDIWCPGLASPGTPLRGCDSELVG